MVCRVCLNKSEFEINIFGEDSADHQIALVIKKHFWFTPCPDDEISTMICLECWKIVRDFHEFYETVAQAHKLFYEAKNLKSDSTELSALKDMHEEVQIEQVDCIETLYKYEQMEATESESSYANIELQDPTAQSNQERDDEDSNIVTSNLENEDLDDEDYKPDFGILQKQIKKSKPKPKNTNATKVKQEKRWANAKTEDIIRKHLNLNCDICSFPTKNFGELVVHFQESHANIKAYIACCGRRFSNKQRVAQHAYMHEDPNSFQCDICNKNFASSYSLHSHKIGYHPSENELIFSCDQCDKRYPRQHLLEYHKATHVPIEERKYLCTHCQKTFASEHLLKAHTSMNHTRSTNVCHICAKTIRDKPSFKKHVRLHYEESGPRVKCPHAGCDKYLKDEENLKVHLRRHKQENMKFPCNQCEKVFNTRIALTSHKGYTHNPKEFSCNLCSKTFKRKITLKEHMAYHSGDPLYKCPFCTRTFNSNANMHSHKKKQHPVEWEIWRKTKTTSAQAAINQI